MYVDKDLFVEFSFIKKGFVKKNKMPIKDWSFALQWADDKHEDLVKSCLLKNVLKDNLPRIPSTLSAMNQVSTHFEQEQDITETTLNLYYNMMNCTKYEVIAFLKSVEEKSSDELFFDMPSELISSMKGKPCRARDHELLCQLTAPNQIFSKNPTVLVSNSKETILYVKGKEVDKIKKGGLLVAVPTSTALEQFAVVNYCKDQCTLLSITRKGIVEVCDFDLPLPDKDSSIDWIDCVVYENHNILFWGGTDALRGQVTWSYSTAIDPFLKTDFFYEVDHPDKIASNIQTQGLNKQDYTKHGNLLTVWKRYIETEFENKRKWKNISSVQTVTHKVADCLSDTTCVWGSPQQYVLTTKNTLTVYLCGVKQSEFTVDAEIEQFCVLYAHSK